MQMQELIVDNFNEHHIFYVSEDATPVKLVIHNGVLRLIIKTSGTGPCKSMRISRYGSYYEVPKTAFYIDSILINNGLYHYFEMDSQ